MAVDAVRVGGRQRVAMDAVRVGGRQRVWML